MALWGRYDFGTPRTTSRIGRSSSRSEAARKGWVTRRSRGSGGSSSRSLGSGRTIVIRGRGTGTKAFKVKTGGRLVKTAPPPPVQKVIDWKKFEVPKIRRIS